MTDTAEVAGELLVFEMRTHQSDAALAEPDGDTGLTTRMNWLIGDLLNGAEQDRWTHSDSTTGPAVASVYLVDDPSDELHLDRFVPAASRPQLVVKLGSDRIESGTLEVGQQRIVSESVKVHTLGNDTNTGADEIAVDWLRSVRHEKVRTRSQLSISVEKLTSLVCVLSEDKDKLRALLLESQREIGSLEAEVLRLQELLNAQAAMGQAVLRGNPISAVEAKSWAKGLRTFCSLAFAGVVGNRTDALLNELLNVIAELGG